MSEVFFTPEVSGAAVVKIFEKISRHINGKIGIKLHFGEPGNKNFLKGDMIRPLCEKLNATLCDTNVLYVGERRHTATHLQVAKKHGFDFAPVDILDSEGEYLHEQKNLKHFSSFHLGSHILNYDSFVLFTHVKGHVMAGIGGALKNASMGFAAPSGKMAMHATGIPVTHQKRCVSCGLCVSQCPGNAISIDPLNINESKCLGCGECIGVCPNHAFDVPWGSTKITTFRERLVEYAAAATKCRPMVYINVLANISEHCDCLAEAPAPFMEDIGILASTDIVAIDQASYDLIDKASGLKDTFLEHCGVGGKEIIAYAEKCALGLRKYQIINC